MTKVPASRSYDPYDPHRERPKWWQRRCDGRLLGPEILMCMEFRCNWRRGHVGECYFDPDDWPELAPFGGWRGLRDRRQA